MAQSATPFYNVVKAGGGGAAAITATGAAATTAAAESARDVKNHMFYSVPLPITVLPHHSSVGSVVTCQNMTACCCDALPAWVGGDLVRFV